MDARNRRHVPHLGFLRVIVAVLSRFSQAGDISGNRSHLLFSEADVWHSTWMTDVAVGGAKEIFEGSCRVVIALRDVHERRSCRRPNHVARGANL